MDLTLENLTKATDSAAFLTSELHAAHDSAIDSGNQLLELLVSDLLKSSFELEQRIRRIKEVVEADSNKRTKVEKTS